LKKLQTSLGSERILLEFISSKDGISVFAVTDEKIEFFENLAQEEEISDLLESLHFQFETMRYGEANLELFASDLKKRTDFYLQKLYQKLFSRLETSIGNRHLVIVPFGGLHYLPFHALFNGESYVIEKREVSYAPSATVLQYCLGKERRNLQNALLIGFSDEKIPFVIEEVKNLEKVLTKNLSLIDKKATFDNFKKNAENFDVIHLACHGQFRKDNPMFSSLRLADGFLTVRDICELKLNAELVVLSACETGLNKILAGEELLGLTRGFLSAGASSLILTLWTVNDRSAQELVINFYKNLQNGETISGSLRNAQCNLIKQNLHPYFWSPFFLTGRW
jgi:CHAT domain-containing protein